MIEAGRSGRGQVVDAAIVDGTASLMTMFHSFLQMGAWATERGVNIIDGGAPFYDVYETSDGKFVSVAAVEAKFYGELVERMGLARELATQAARSETLAGAARALRRDLQVPDPR